ncbi:hypothetical protein [Pseudomarimonas salicorniae]|uniref:Uncharacterized protein n=1 Tax=Pseudomarimonas salicorniae TaxID=2933270 RepID=A0ABT0GGS8_9GAMM|nr:hypothetical protein [Lysobacter sp. CAU 1642]MCK7593734.1 hypothetical protein [Lysobacter sp. CAU 1642]
MRLLFAALCTLSTSAAIAQAAPPGNPAVDTVREALETPFREQTGLAFSRFDCDLPQDIEQPGLVEFSCHATDEEGDRFTYRLWRDQDSGESMVSQWQPLEQVPPTVLAPLTEAADRFLEGFATADWPATAAARHPRLAESQSEADLAAALGALREGSGRIEARRAMLFSQPGPGTYALEYRLDSERGPLLARIQLRREGGNTGVSGYLIVPEDGTRLAAAMLQEQATEALTPLIGAPINALNVDLERLQRAGDAEVAAAEYGDGQRIAVLVTRVGTAFDYEPLDYRFSILDVPWMVARHEVQSGRPESTVQCPGRVARDGGHLDCTVTRKDGSEVVYRVERQGGEHRMSPRP